MFMLVAQRTRRYLLRKHFVLIFSYRYLPLVVARVQVRADYEFEHGRPAGAVNIPAFFSTAQGMTVNPQFVDQVRRPSSLQCFFYLSTSCCRLCMP